MGDTPSLPPSEQSSYGPSRSSSDYARSPYGERIIILSGYALMISSVASFLRLIILGVVSATRSQPRYQTWLDFASSEVTTIILLLVAVLTALVGRRILLSTQVAYTRTIPTDDYPLISQAVIAGKPEPIDQYVRLRSLSGWAGTFTKLGITGLPLTTVALTLIFATASVFPIQNANAFMDLAKLTLGAFIGSFVQRSVEQRKQEAKVDIGAPPSKPDLPA